MVLVAFDAGLLVTVETSEQRFEEQCHDQRSHDADEDDQSCFDSEDAK